jgi:hypothetical protein
LNVFKRAKKNFLQDALRWRIMLCGGAKETQRSIAKLSQRAKATFSDA